MELAEDDVIQLLEEIEKRGPLHTVPSLPGVSAAVGRALAEQAGRRSWTTTGSFKRDGSVRSQVLDLTDSGADTLQRARIERLSPIGEPSASDAVQRRAMRGELMASLYSTVGDDTRRVVAPGELAVALGWQETDVRAVARHLAERDLVAVRDLAGGLAITRSGIEEVEEAVNRPAAGSQHLAGMAVEVGDAGGSVQVIQTAGGPATISSGPPAGPSGADDSSSKVRRALVALAIGVAGSLIAAAIWAVVVDDGSADADGTTTTETTSTGPPSTETTTAPPTTSVGDPSLDIQVEGRSETPDQIDSPGLQVLEGQPQAITVLAGEPQLVLTYEGWNTIVDTSEVPELVDIVADEELNLDRTGYNRFQYLADRIAQYDIDSFRPVGIVAGFDRDEAGLILIAALYNPTDQPVLVEKLEAAVYGRNDQSLLGAQTFYTDAPPTLPPRTVFFARLPFIESTSEMRDTGGVTFEFGFETEP